MLPDIDDDVVLEGDEDDDEELVIESDPSNTYKLNTTTDNISGEVDHVEAVKQAIYHILATERYEYPIYSEDYGVETRDLMGMPPDYVCATLEMRVKEALEQDDRIDSIENFTAEVTRDKVHVSFLVHSTEGDFEQEGDFDV